MNTLDYHKPTISFPRERRVPFWGLIIWLILFVVLLVIPYLNPAAAPPELEVTIGLLGLAALIISGIAGLQTQRKILRTTGIRDAFLSWTLAVNMAILLMWSFFLLLAIPPYLHGRY